jgi:FMN phosphatase YigB (HAD superfamily)
MLRAVLFDLDNTLIRFDEREFFERYVSEIVPVFSDFLPPGALVERLILSTQALMNNNGEKSNAEYFMSVFCSGWESLKEEIWGRFLAFYEREFDGFRFLVSVPSGVREVLAGLKKKGIKVVIASNPIWPLIVQVKRLSWAGIGELELDLITHIENMSYCKPRLEYYLEICSRIDERPESCLMVGNDPVNDMVVAVIGMRTYLVTNEGKVDESAIALSRRIQPDKSLRASTPDFVGPLSRVPEAVERLLIWAAGDPDDRQGEGEHTS